MAVQLFVKSISHRFAKAALRKFNGWPSIWMLQKGKYHYDMSCKQKFFPQKNNKIYQIEAIQKMHKKDSVHY